MSDASPPVRLDGERVFPYVPLNADKRSIRVLQVLPDLKDNQIQCRLSHATTATAYTCLSYVWGDPDPADEIVLNGLSFPVRRGLHDFLKIARDQYTGTFLWIDSICINQEDDVERGQQVQNMGAIYGSAESVIAWLGICPEVGPALNVNQRLSEIWQSSVAARRAIKDRGETPPELRGGEALRDYLNEKIEQCGPSASDKAAMNRSVSHDIQSLLWSLVAVTQHDYWTRAWIVQEVALSRFLVIRNGNSSISPEQLETLFAMVEHQPGLGGVNKLFTDDDNLEEALQAVTCSRLVSRMDQIFRCRRTKRDIVFYLEFSRHAACGIVKDKIFSILGLVANTDEFIVSYDDDEVTLFYKTCNYFDLWWYKDDIVMNILGLNIDRISSNELGRARIAIKVIIPNLENTKTFKCPSCRGDVDCSEVDFQIEEYELLGCLPKKAGHLLLRKGVSGYYESHPLVAAPDKYNWITPNIGHIQGATLMRWVDRSWERVENGPGMLLESSSYRLEVPRSVLLRHLNAPPGPTWPAPSSIHRLMDHTEGTGEGRPGPPFRCKDRKLLANEHIVRQNLDFVVQ